MLTPLPMLEPYPEGEEALAVALKRSSHQSLFSILPSLPLSLSLSLSLSPLSLSPSLLSLSLPPSLLSLSLSLSLPLSLSLSFSLSLSLSLPLYLCCSSVRQCDRPQLKATGSARSGVSFPQDPPTTAVLHCLSPPNTHSVPLFTTSTHTHLSIYLFALLAHTTTHTHT